MVLGRTYKDEVNNYDKAVEDIINRTVDLIDLKNVSEFYNREKLIEKYHSGQEIESLEYRSYVSGEKEPRWLHSAFQIVKNQILMSLLFISLPMILMAIRTVQPIPEKIAPQMVLSMSLYQKLRLK